MKKLILLLSLIAICTLAFADIYTIGTGTSTSGYCPFNGLYDYSWSKAIWTAAELTTAGVPANTPITGIGFYVGNTPSNYTMLDQRIYVRTTALTSYGTATDETGTGYPNPAGFLQLFQGNLTYNGSGWHYIMFTTPATWDGTSNLELLFENWDGDYVTGYPTFRYTSTSPNYMMVYKAKDDSFPLPTEAGTRSYNRPNVAIITPSTTPPQAPVLSSPSDGATGVSITPTFSWTAPTSGAVPTGYKVYLGESSTLTDANIIANVTSLFYTIPSNTPLQYNHTYYWTVSAYNEHGDGPKADPVRSFTTRTDPTIYNFPYWVDFTTWPVPNWSQLKYTFGGTPATGGNWMQDEWLNVSGSTNKAARLNIYGTSRYDWLITPPIQIPDTGYELKFDLALMKYGTNNPVDVGGQPDDRFIVAISNNPDMTSSTILKEWNNTGSPDVYDNIPNTGTTCTIDLSAYVGTKYIAFYGESTASNGDNDLMVDNFTISQVSTGPILYYTPTSLNFGEVTQGVMFGPKKITITNVGIGTLELDKTNNTQIIGTGFVVEDFSLSLGANQSGEINVYANAIQEGPFSAILKITYSGVDYDVALSATGLPAGIVVIGTGTADLDMPVNTYYGYTYCQSIYLQSELNIENRRIEKIYYYWNGAAVAVNSNNWTVYMGHTPNTSFASGTAWIPLSNLTQVFSGTVTLPAVAGWIEIVLNNPFIYDNINNLVIAVDENAPNFDSTSHFFYCTSVATNRSLRYYSDGTNPDPAIPPTGTTVMGYPNVKLQFGELPQAPIFYYSPTSIAYGTTFANTPTAYQNVTVTNTGGGVLNLAVEDVSIIGTNASMFNVNTSNLPAALSSGQSVIIPVRYNPTAAGNHTATLRMVYNSVNYDVALSGNALSEHALYESFEGATFPPTGWATATIPWEIYTYYTHTGTKSVKSGYTTGTWWLMTPTLSIHEGANILTFWYRDYSESTGWDYVDEYTYVMLSTTGNAPENFTTTLWTGDYLTFTTTWQMASIDLSAYNGQNVVIAFKSVHTGGNYRIIDDVAGLDIYVPSGPPDPVTLTYPANGATGLPKAGFNLMWTPATTGGAPDYYAVYMSPNEETIYGDYYWETTNTSFNPVTAPTNPITFNYGERWYWTVEAINDDGNAVVEPPYSFEIVKPIQIFPWTENFDAALTLPAGWTMYDLDGAGTFWQVSSTYSHSSPNSFKHGYSTAVPEGQNGWLITPPVQIPTTGHYVLSWWNYNVYPAWMVYNGLKVNTTDDPNDPNWIELWSPASVASAWSNAVVNITPYAGQTVYFAFNYQGYDADDWYIDDVSIYELIADEFPPIITHLPVLNTPRDDINYLVYAEITDDPNWNNPIGGANLYYSTDSGTTWSEPIAMTPGTAPEYTAYIPAQPLGTTVDYYLEAWDSEMNMATTDTYSFSVNNPTWIRYDTGGTVYLGYSAYIFGPTMLYENPYYGTGIPLKLLETDGESYDATTANLHIYSFDGVTMTDLITPLAVSFPAQTHQIFDLSSYDINITTPYFLISYEDIPAGNYFLWDDTYDYGTTFVRISGQLYTLGDRTGAWCIGAYVTNGISAIETPVVTIYNVAGNPVLSWNAVSGANGYKVYASADPYAPEPWEQIAFITGTTYTYTGTDDKKFFKVTAVTEAPTKGSYYLSGRALNTKEMKPNISSAHTKKVTSVVAPKVKIENQRKK